MTPGSVGWRALIAFTTAQRAGYVKRCLPQLVNACGADARLAVLVALDGDDPETRSFCSTWDVPLLYSDTREGVGLSKNRVLERFPGYDYYFFIEDDVEVLDGSVFARHVELMQAGSLHHMSLFPPVLGREPLGQTLVLNEPILHFQLGVAFFNAFTGQGLATVGGWHPLFAEYRRWGHTEHSCRFVFNQLAKAPFNVAVRLAPSCIWHLPPSVTSWASSGLVGADGLAEPERQLIQQKLQHVPLVTFAPYRLEGPEPSLPVRLAEAVSSSSRRYPFLSGAEHRHALADLQLWRFETHRGVLRRVVALCAATLLHPRSLELRHVVKTRLIALRERAARR